MQRGILKSFVNINFVVVEGKGAKKPKTTKGHHASRNAYMLVYRKKLEDKSGTFFYCFTFKLFTSYIL